MADISNLPTKAGLENLPLPNGHIWRSWGNESPSRTEFYSQAHVSGTMLSESGFEGFFDSFQSSANIASRAEELACELDDFYTDPKNLHIPINIVISILFTLREEGASESRLTHCLEQLRLAFWHTDMEIRKSILREIIPPRPKT